MAMSIDALLALIVFVALVAFISTDPTSDIPLTQPRLASNQLIDDAIAAMDSTGFIMQCIENGQFEEMETKLEAMLPESMDYNIEIIRYEAPLDIPDNECRDPILGQNFETCFPYDVNVYTIGSERPTDKDLFHGQKIFIKKEGGDCSLITVFEEKQKWIQAMFAGDNAPEAMDVNITTADSCPGKRNPCPLIDEWEMRCCYTYYDEDSDPQDSVAYKWYKYDEETKQWKPTAEIGPTHSFDETNDTNRFKCSVTVSDGPNPEDWGTDTNSPLAIIGGPCFVFESEVTKGGNPITEYNCGDIYNISFAISAETGGRQDPVDIMLAIDRSGSMSWFGFNENTTDLAKSIFIDSSGASDVAYFGTSNNLYKFLIDNQTGGLTELANTSAIDDVQGLFVDDSYVYIADKDTGLRILNKGDLSLVRIIGEDGGKEITTAKSVFVEGNYIYLAAAGTYIAGTEKKYDAEMDSERNQEDIRIGYNLTESWAAQSFVPGISDINGVDIEVIKYGSPGDLILKICTTQQCNDIRGSLTISSNSISTNWGTWLQAEFSQAASVTPGQTYYIVLTKEGSASTNDYYKWGSRLSSSNPYSNGALYSCTSGGSCTEQWEEGSGWDPDEYEDARFRTYHYASLVGGLIIIDKSDPDPNNWSILNNIYDTGIGLIDRPQDIAVSGNCVYVTDKSGGDGTQGLWVIDITNKSNPEMKGFVETTNAYSVEVSGNYAYVTDRASGVKVIDVTNKSNPSIATTVTGLGIVDDIAIYGTSAYVNADTPAGSGPTNYGLHVIDITTPASASLQQTYYTQFVIAGENEYALAVSPDWMAMANSYETSAMTLSRSLGHKMNIARESSKDFVLFEDWNSPQDMIGIASYGNNNGYLDHELSDTSFANKLTINTATDTILAYNGTPMNEGLETAIDELIGPRGRVDAIQFIILLADGQSDSGTQNSIDTQVARAKTNEIYIFTIGFGGDVDETQLENIATEAYCPNKAAGDCGSYHHISDPDALDEIYLLIAEKIAELSGRMPDGATTDISLDFGKFGNGTEITNYAPGIWDEDNNVLNFENIDIRFGWEGSFDATITCNYIGCGEDFVEGSRVSFPPRDTMVSYSLDGIEQDPIQWPGKFEVETVLYYNDLGIEFVEGLFYSTTDTTVKYNVLNEGYQSIALDDINPTVNFYSGETSETACGGDNIGTESFSETLDAAYGLDSGINTSVKGKTNLNRSGYICIWVNEPPQTNVIECEENNQILINCDIPETYIYAMDYWVWEK